MTLSLAGVMPQRLTRYLGKRIAESFALTAQLGLIGCHLDLRSGFLLRAFLGTVFPTDFGRATADRSLGSSLMLHDEL